MWTALLFTVFCCSQAINLRATNTTALDDYIAFDDGEFAWFDTGAKIDGLFSCDGYVLNMTSQRWLTDKDSSASVWTHQLVVLVPHELKSQDTAGIWITGGENGKPSVPDGTDEDIIVAEALAMGTGMVTAALFQIPNAPIYFPTDPLHKRRTEDAIIAFTWRHYLDNPDEPNWILRLPMTKAVVKAFDAVEAFTKQKGIANISKWTAAGASKRGWTTWTTAAVDKRIIAITPVVWDLLHFNVNVAHQYQAYGGWTWAFKDYYAENITAEISNENTTKLSEIVDAYFYFDRLTMPKMLVNSCDDEFLMPDDTRLYWDELPDEKHFVIAQNAEHSMATGIIEAIDTITNFQSAVVYGRTRPNLTWTRDFDSGKMTVTCSEKPVKVVARQANTLSTTRRDFRWAIALDDDCQFPLIPIKKQNICVQPILWFGEELEAEDDAGLVYSYTVETPTQGWRAMFLEVYFASNNNLPVMYRMTTEVTIQPNTMPFPACEGTACRGTLV